MKSMEKKTIPKKENAKYGVFYGVGTGPGDPELITLKAVRIIEHCPVIAAPRTNGGDMVALDIVRKIVDLGDKLVMPMDFTMDRDVSKRQDSYRRNADAAAAYLDKGMDIAMVNLGDVSIYSTFHYVAEEVEKRGYETAMIPGITSFSAIAASLNMSLTEMNQPLHIIPAVGEKAGESLALPGTKVLMKAGRRLPDLQKELERRGLLDVTSVAVNCGMEDELLIKALEKETDISENTGYFTTVIVRDKSI